MKSAPVRSPRSIRGRAHALAAGTLALFGGGIVTLCVTERPAPAGGPLPPELVLLETDGRSEDTAVTALDLERGTTHRLSAVTHLADAAVRGALIRSGDAVAVVADRAPGGDRSWGSSLFIAEPGRPTSAVCDRVRYGARPLTDQEGGVIYIERGAPGQPHRDSLREDELELAAIDAAPASTVRTLYRTQGFELYPAAVVRDEVVVYLIDRAGAHLLGVRRDGQTRTILGQLAPFARDFFVRKGALVFTSRDGSRPERPTLEEVDLTTGLTRRLLESERPIVAPRALLGDEIVFFDGQGLSLLSGSRRPAAIEVVRAESRDGWAAGWRYPTGAPLPDVVVEHLPSGRATTLAAKGHRHFDVVGFRGAR
jgi:hypothetical protein